jgi:hypothetical protein
MEPMELRGAKLGSMGFSTISIKLLIDEKPKMPKITIFELESDWGVGHKGR